MTNASHLVPRSARPLLIISFLTCALSGNAQEKHNPEGNYRASIQQQLAFENSVSEGVPDGWSGSAGTVGVDRKIVHSGQAAVRFVRDARSKDNFSVITKSIPIDFVGSYIQLCGYLKTSNVEGTVGFWMREDGTERALQFDNMQSHRVEGTTDWNEYAVTLPIDPRATRLFFGYCSMAQEQPGRMICNCSLTEYQLPRLFPLRERAPSLNLTMSLQTDQASRSHHCRTLKSRI